MHKGRNRGLITQDYITHGGAEDYSGVHKSEIKINGKGKVIKIINKFKSHEDSINYNTFLEKQSVWYSNGIYECISITGKNVKMSIDELGGNQVWIETYDDNNLIILRLCHLDSVLVSLNQIVDENSVIGLQGNTGLVLSGKSVTDRTYGTHVHLEATINNEFVNPRKYATGEVTTTYLNYDNGLDETKNQIKILVNQINIRALPDEVSNDLGDVYYNEYYNVLEIIDKELYTWYKVKTNNGIIGYVASSKKEKWLEYIESKVVKDVKLIYECQKDGSYLIKLYKNEKLYISK